MSGPPRETSEAVEGCDHPAARELRAGAEPVPAPGTRTAARQRAVDLLYEADVLGQSIVVVLERERHVGGSAAPLDAYTVELVEGVDRLRERLDDRIRAASVHWKLERMPLIDRNLLRLATFELEERREVPTAVVLDEAVKLAKLLSTADSGKFVNGVLAEIARAVRR